MITCNHYTNNRDYTWYDSSNVVYSECIDTKSDTKNIKIVYKGGRQYLYKDVDVNDYLLFKNAESNGKALNEFIKKYKFVRLPDVDLNELEEKRKKFINEQTDVERVTSQLDYHLQINSENKQFRLLIGDKVIYEGIEDNVSIIRLLKCMCINYSLEELKEEINLNPEE